MWVGLCVRVWVAWLLDLADLRATVDASHTSGPRFVRVAYPGHRLSEPRVRVRYVRLTHPSRARVRVTHPRQARPPRGAPARPWLPGPRASESRSSESPFADPSESAVPAIRARPGPGQPPARAVELLCEETKKRVSSSPARLSACPKRRGARLFGQAKRRPPRPRAPYRAPPGERAAVRGHAVLCTI